MKSIKLTLIIGMLLSSSFTFSQIVNNIWVTLKVNPSISTVGGQITSQQNEIQALINSFHITSFEKLVPTTKTDALKDVYEINCNCDEHELLAQVARMSDLFANPEIGPKYQTLDIPNDYSIAFANDWALNLINAPGAWDVTHGDTNVVIAITDANYVLGHEDLVGKVNYVSPNNYNSNYAHGTAVAVSAGGNTNNGVGKSSIGYDSHLELRMMSYNEVLLASQAGADVINMSWAASCYYSSYGQMIITEAYNNGSVLVAAAGNGGTCGGASNLVYPAAYNHVISVTSIGEFDNHEGAIGDPASCHQHNAMVDLCAPGYLVPVTAGTGWYLVANGTSFASPIVAGLAALMLSVNPCLNADEIEYIMKQTAVNVDALNPAYVGGLGSGRIDAAAAVQMAKNFTTLHVSGNSGMGCFPTTGYATINVLDGQGEITYNWAIGDTTQTISNQNGGIYNVQVRDERGCFADTNLLIPAFIPLSATAVVSDVTCYGLSDGAIDLTVTSGHPQYVFDWTYNGSTVDTEDIDSLPAGTYRVRIQDSLGCVLYQSYNVYAPEQLILNATIQQPIYNNGSIDVTVTGGTPGYTYDWSNINSSSNYVSGLGAGQYYLEVYDAHGCFEAGVYTLTSDQIEDDQPIATELGIGNHTAGVEDLNTFDVELYPNPVHEGQLIQIKGIAVEEIKVMNQFGAQVKYQKGGNSLDLNEFAAGVYYVQISSANQTMVKKMIKN